MVKRIEQVLRAADRFQQRHSALGFPVGVVKKFGDDQAGKHAALLLCAAEVNVVLTRRLWPRSLLGSPLTGPDRQVLTALAQTEERLPGQTIEVSFSPEVSGDDTHPSGG